MTVLACFDVHRVCTWRAWLGRGRAPVPTRPAAQHPQTTNRPTNPQPSPQTHQHPHNKQAPAPLQVLHAVHGAGRIHRHRVGLAEVNLTYFKQARIRPSIPIHTFTHARVCVNGLGDGSGYIRFT